MDKIKAIVYGVGAMGKIMTKLMIEKGVIIVGAIGNIANVGRDLGEVAGLDYPLNVKISNDAEAILSGQKADIAVVALFTEMDKMYPHLAMCLKHGLNVITTSEEAFYPWPTAPELTAKLDKLAKRHRVTITGSGFDDGLLVNIVSMLSGASHHIESLTLREQFNADDYGPVLAEYLHIGESKEEFDNWFQTHPDEAGFTRPVLECQIADLGLNVKSVRQSFTPILAGSDLEAHKLGRLVKKGLVSGMLEVMEIETDQGIRFRAEMIGKVYSPDEVDLSEGYIEGTPNLHLAIHQLNIGITTCTQMVNRIPDVVNAAPGFITVEKLPKLKYRAYPLHFYLGQ